MLMAGSEIRKKLTSWGKGWDFGSCFIPIIYKGFFKTSKRWPRPWDFVNHQLGITSQASADRCHPHRTRWQCPRSCTLARKMLNILKKKTKHMEFSHKYTHGLKTKNIHFRNFTYCFSCVEKQLNTVHDFQRFFHFLPSPRKGTHQL